MDNEEGNGDNNENDNQDDNDIDIDLDDQLQSKVLALQITCSTTSFSPVGQTTLPFALPVRDTDASKSSQSVYPEDSTTVSRFSFCHSKAARRWRVRGNP